MIEKGTLVWLDAREMFGDRTETSYWIVGLVVDTTVEGTDLVNVETGLAKHTIKVNGATFRAELKEYRLISAKHVEPLDVVEMIGLLDRECWFCVNGLLRSRIEVRRNEHPWDVIGWARWTETGWSDGVHDLHRSKPAVCRCTVPPFVSGNSTTIEIPPSINTATNTTTITLLASALAPVSRQLHGRRLRSSGRRRPGLSPDEVRQFRAQSRNLARRPPRAR